MRRVAGALKIRPGEGRMVALLAVVFAAAEAGRAVGEIGVDTLVISRLGVGVLPYLLIGLGVLAMVASLGYGAAVGRSRRGPFFIAAPAAAAALLLLERALVGPGGPWIYPVLWLTVNIVAVLALSLQWNLAGGVLDARQAKRLFPLLTSAAIVGGFAGTLSAGPLAAFASAADLVVAEALLLLATAAVTLRVAAGRSSLWERPRGRSFVAELRTGLAYVRASRLMSLVAASYVLFAVLYFTVSLSFLRAASAAHPDEAQLAGFLGLIYTITTAASFAVSLLVANRLYARVGIAGAALALPVVYLAGFALWLATFSLASTVLVRFAQLVMARGVTNAAFSALHNVVPPDRRAQVLAFNDGVPGQLGTIASGGLLVVAGTALTLDQLFVVGAATAAACAVLIWRVRHEYGRALVATLRAGMADRLLESDAGSRPLSYDAQARAVLLEGLGDERPAVRCLAAEMAARMGERDAIAPLIGLFSSDDAEVRATAVRAVSALGAREAVAGVRTLMADREPSVRAAAVDALAALDPVAVTSLPEHDPDPLVRARIAVALITAARNDVPGVEHATARAALQSLVEAADPGTRALALAAVAELGGVAPPVRLADHLDDPDGLVRAAAARAIGDASDADSAPRLVHALDDRSPAVRRAAAEAIGKLGEEAVHSVLAVLSDGSDAAQAAALTALAGHGEEVRETLEAWALARIGRATELRSSAAALRSADTSARSARSSELGGDAAVRFLTELLEQREWEEEERVLRSLALLGAPEASGIIQRGLRSDDTETRAQALEALDTLGDRRIASALLPLLEGDVRGRTRLDGRVVVDALTRDVDPWVRALAVRVQRDRLLVEWQHLLDLAGADASPRVREAVDGRGPFGGGKMAETQRTLATMDRILFLREVPIFAGLAPEDLQRLAEAAAERLHPRGEVIYREGDVGEELAVIVEGTARVTKGAGDTARTLITYGRGEHIGELAVLRRQPRAATVIADEDIRVLVIGGDMLRAVLLERPEAAMAMLESLAERVTTKG